MAHLPHYNTKKNSPERLAKLEQFKCKAFPHRYNIIRVRKVQVHLCGRSIHCCTVRRFPKLPGGACRKGIPSPEDATEAVTLGNRVVPTLPTVPSQVLVQKPLCRNHEKQVHGCCVVLRSDAVVTHHEFRPESHRFPLYHYLSR